jgi:hypothetical protein
MPLGVRRVGELQSAQRSRRSWAVGVALLNAMAIGCDGGAPVQAAERIELASRVTGIWDAELTLDRTPGGPVRVEPARRGDGVQGSLALLPGRGDVGVEWLHREATHAGVYDLDFTPMRLPMSHPHSVPVMVAAVVAPDSLIAVIPEVAGSGALELRGVLAADSVTGRWSFQSHAVGGWGGSFVLHRRAGRASR